MNIPTNSIPKKLKKSESDAYKLGRVSAKIDQQNKELDQKVQMNTIQQVMLQTLSMKVQDNVAQLDRKQKDLESMMRSIQSPVVPPPMPMPDNISGAPVDPSQLQAPGGMPPDIGGMQQGQGMPPDMGGAPPSM